MSIELGNPRRNSSMRMAITMMSFFCIASGSISAFGSLARLGQRVQVDEQQNYAAGQESDRRIAEMNRVAQEGKERERLGIARQTSQFVINGYVYRQESFFKDMQPFYEAIESFAESKRLTLTDSKRMIIGTYDNGYLCDRANNCKNINQGQK